MSRKKGRAKAKHQRRQSAIEAQDHLSGVITDVSMPMIARRNAAKHLVKTSIYYFQVVALYYKHQFQHP